MSRTKSPSFNDDDIPLSPTPPRRTPAGTSSSPTSPSYQQGFPADKHHHASRLTLLFRRASLLLIVIMLIVFALTHLNNLAPLFHLPVNQSIFVQQATNDNIEGDSTVINNQMTNGNPSATLFVTQLWNPQGNGGIYNNHPIGVWYNNTEARWEIFNEDRTPMTPNTAFNVIVGSGLANGNLYLHTTSATTDGSDYTDLNNSTTNGNPQALVLITPNWNPNGASTGVYDPHPVGVWYNAGTGRWSIFNEDQASMPANTAFNVLAFSSGNDSIYTLTSNSSNTRGDFTDTTDSLSTDTNAYVFVTPNWNPGGSRNRTYLNHNLGVWSDHATGRFSIFNQDLADMPYGVSFNVLILLR